MNHFTALCRSRREYSRHSRHSRREPHRSRHSSRSSSRSSSRNRSSRSSSRNRSHNIHTRRHRSPTPHPIDTIITSQDFIASNSDTEDSSTQLKKCKNRHPTPLPTNVFSHITYSNTEDPEDTASEASIPIHSQDEDSFDYNAISPPRTYYIPITPPRTMLPRPSTMLPRPSCIPIPKPCKTTKIQHNKNKPAAQKVRPSCIPVFNNKKQKPTTQVTQPNVQQPSSSLPRPTEETTRKQPTYDHPEPTLVRKPPQKSPLLPTPPASERISNTNNYKQHLTRPSTFNSRKSTFARPSEFNNCRFHQQHIPRPSASPPRYNTYPTFSGPVTNNYSYYQQPHIPGPHTANLPYLHQEFFTRPYQQIPLLPLPAFTGPYQQISGHLTPQVCYLPILIPHPLQHCTA